MREDNNLQLEIVPTRPGMAHIVGADEFANMLLGMRARRIVACVNACAGIDTGLLEGLNRDDIAAEFIALHNQS